MPFINRCGDAPKLQTKTVTPLGTQQTIIPDDGYEGLEQVTVNPPIFQTKTMVVDGTVVPDEGYTGLNSVTVNIPYDVYKSSILVSTLPTFTQNNHTADLYFDMGDSMSYHTSNPSKIVILCIYTGGMFAVGTSTYGICGASLLRYNDSQYYGDIYISSEFSGNNLDIVRGNRIQIGSPPTRVINSSTGQTRYYGVNVSYDGETNKMLIDVSKIGDYSYYSGDSDCNAAFYTKHIDSIDAYFMWE